MTDSPELAALVERLRELLAKAELGELAYQERTDAYTHILRQGAHEFVVQFGQSTNPKYEARARLFAEAINALPTLLAALSSAPVAGTHVLDDSGLVCSCRARFSTRWEAAEHAGLPHDGPLGALSHASPVDEGMVMVPYAELKDFADVIGNLISELSDPGSGAMAAQYRINRMIQEHRLAASTPKDTGERG